MFDIQFSALIQALILFILSSSTSEGDHDKFGRDNANFTMCWPVPLAISKASPDLGAICLIKLIIGVLFLSAEGEIDVHHPLNLQHLLFLEDFVLRRDHLISIHIYHGVLFP